MSFRWRDALRVAWLPALILAVLAGSVALYILR
jgi:hypothetical protein